MSNLEKLDRYNVLLLLRGDPYENKGIKNYGLGIRFPRYAEFWARYVHPNRNPKNSSKLYPSFPQEFEKILNAHYSVWRHITIAYYQLENVKNPLVEYSDILYHLATVIDLTELVFVLAIETHSKINEKTIFTKLDESSYNEKVKLDSKEYLKQFKKFVEKHIPSVITLHSVSQLFQTQIKQISHDNTARKNYLTVTGIIRKYRNKLAHYIPPINLIDDGITKIPKPEHLDKYKDGYYSSIDIDPDHFESAEIVLRELADELVEKTNGLWKTLLETMAEIASSPKHKPCFKESTALIEPNKLHLKGPHNLSRSIDIDPSGIHTKKKNPYTGGTIDIYETDL